ncbi:hypothetical protein A8H39_01620 [Paraburkholderia fungorum]|uniref:hypothetical protein n=1 Tax=Paraburkholderia fungorum TaxID=134537 RepID=UPI000480C724|nr:hypothetical protein [Paraburkholderia fungorum]PNE59870.1 hypothetical protein A8H39_01620 [Paraburkholderia fungorum]
MNHSSEGQQPRIEGVPARDGYYWYYKRGAVLPSLVMIGTRGTERIIKEGPASQRCWFPGEFFVGPIEPPVGTPDALARSEARHGEEIWIEPVSGPAVTAD